MPCLCTSAELKSKRRAVRRTKQRCTANKSGGPYSQRALGCWLGCTLTLHGLSEQSHNTTTRISGRSPFSAIAQNDHCCGVSPRPPIVFFCRPASRLVALIGLDGEEEFDSFWGKRIITCANWIDRTRHTSERGCSSSIGGGYPTSVC